MSSFQLHLGDCLEVMNGMPEASVSSIICDPPYGINFMSSKWDHGVPGVPFWEAALRVARPGAMLLAFGGTRTFHRLTVAIEDAGWEIRDCLMWLYGSGFPKGIAVDKAIDKHFGKEREVVGSKEKLDSYGVVNKVYGGGPNHNGTMQITAPATPEAAQWQGWHSSLKPSWEPIILAMKPVENGYANNALVHGVAGLNIDATRIASPEGVRTRGRSDALHAKSNSLGAAWSGNVDESTRYGRWPANVLLDEAAAALLDEQSGPSVARPVKPENIGKSGDGNSKGLFGMGSTVQTGYYDDSSKVSRFFYVAKASSRERNEGLQGMEKRSNAEREGRNQYKNGTPLNGSGQLINGDGHIKPKANFHPTVKPIELLKYLCRLTKTPWGGVVLDPFMGSGSTGVAAIMEGRSFIGIDISEEYLAIAEGRLAAASAQPFLFEVNA